MPNDELGEDGSNMAAQMEHLHNVGVVPGQIDLEVLRGRYVVGHASTAKLTSAAWIVTQALLFSEDAAFGGVILDDEGVSLVVEASRADMARRVGLGDALRMDPNVCWRALHLSLGQTANDVPGIISHMAKALMGDGVSILHYSTYGTELFLVREEDLAAALRTFSSQELRQQLECVMSHRNEPLSGPPSPAQPDLWKNGGNRLELVEMDQRLYIARLKREYFHEVSRTLLQLFLYDEHYHHQLLPPAEADSAQPEEAALDNDAAAVVPNENAKPSPPEVESGSAPPKPPPVTLPPVAAAAAAAAAEAGTTEGESESTEDPPTAAGVGEPPPRRFVLAFLFTGDELTLYLDEDDLQLFPEEAIEVCPTPWHGVKLTGREFAFDETGVVSAMSKVDNNVSILSLSTFKTTVTLVAQDHVEQTLDTLSTALGAPVRRSEVPQVDLGEQRW